MHPTETVQDSLVSSKVPTVPKEHRHRQFRKVHLRTGDWRFCPACFEEVTQAPVSEVGDNRWRWKERGPASLPVVPLTMPYSKSPLLRGSWALGKSQDAVFFY